MSTITVAVIAIAGILLTIALAFLPLKLMVHFISKNVTAPIKRFMERQRERRQSSREGPDRRQLP